MNFFHRVSPALGTAPTDQISLFLAISTYRELAASGSSAVSVICAPRREPLVRCPRTLAGVGRAASPAVRPRRRCCSLRMRVRSRRRAASTSGWRVSALRRHGQACGLRAGTVWLGWLESPITKLCGDIPHGVLIGGRRPGDRRHRGTAGRGHDDQSPVGRIEPCVPCRTRRCGACLSGSVNRRARTGSAMRSSCCRSRSLVPTAGGKPAKELGSGPACRNPADLSGHPTRKTNYPRVPARRPRRLPPAQAHRHPCASRYRHPSPVLTSPRRRKTFISTISSQIVHIPGLAYCRDFAEGTRRHPACGHPLAGHDRRHGRAGGAGTAPRPHL